MSRIDLLPLYSLRSLYCLRAVVCYEGGGCRLEGLAVSYQTELLLLS